MLDVLDWVASFGVVVEGRSREFFLNSHSRIALETRIEDLGSGPFRSATKLQLNFLNSSLDQLVESSNVRELLDPPPSMVVMNSHSGTR